MLSQNKAFSRAAGMAIFSALSVMFAAAVISVPRFGGQRIYTAERHLFVSGFVVYLVLALSLVTWRRFRLKGTSEYFSLALGFIGFATFEACQIVVSMGWPVLLRQGDKLASAMALDVFARLVLAILLAVASARIDRHFRSRYWPPAARLFIPAVLVAGLLLSALVVRFLPALLLTQGHATLLKRIVDVLSAAFAGAAACLLLFRFFRYGSSVHFWLGFMVVFELFADLFFALGNAPLDLYFATGFGLQALFCVLLLTLFFIDQPRFLRTEVELRQRLDGLGYGLYVEKSFRDLVESMSDGVATVDKLSMLVFCNRGFAEMLGQEPDTLLGQHLSTCFDQDNYEILLSHAFGENDEPGARFELALQSRTRGQVPVLVQAVRVRSPGDERAGTHFIFSDLSEPKKIEWDLRASLEAKSKSLDLFQNCIEHSTEGVLITDPETTIRYVNKAFQSMTGFTGEELLGTKTSDLVIDRRGQTVHEIIWDAVRSGRVWRGEFQTRRKDGTTFVGEVSVVPIEKRGVSRYLWIERDITRRKTLEKSLKSYTEELTQKTRELEASKAYYESLISGMTDILIVVDNDGNCTFINEYGRQRLGFHAGELTREILPVFFDDLKRLEHDYGNAIEVEIKDFESTIRTKSGDAILCSWHARPLMDSQNRRVGAMALGRDITEYKRLQNELEDYAKNLETKVKQRTIELQAKVEQLAKLLEIGEEIRLNVDIDVVVNKICEAVQSLGWRKVIISLRDFESHTSRAVATAGLTPDKVEEVMGWGEIPFEHTEKYLKEAFQVSNSYFIPEEANLLAEDTPYSIYTDLGEASPGQWQSLDALLVPIRTKDRILGVISVDDPVDRKRPDVNRIRDLEIFADKAALAIENAHLWNVHKENERRAKLLAEMSQLFHASLDMHEVLEAIVHKGGKVLGDFCSLLLLDEQGESLEPQTTYHKNPRMVDYFMKGLEAHPCKAGEGFLGQVVATGKSFLDSHPFPQIKGGFAETPFAQLHEFSPISSVIVVPLRIRGRIIGVMTFLYCDANRRYKADGLKLAQEMADRAALAIENARLFREAGEKARELEKASKMKSEFLANVSHELRTPLNAIITLSDILLREYPAEPDTEQIKQLQIIQRSGKNLLNLINDILDVSKIESGRVEAIFSKIPIRALVEDTLERIRPLCAAKGLKLEYECAKAVPEFIYSDEDKLNKALTNVLSNAVKFTRKGKVAVRVDVEVGEKLRIEISDTGIGIPQDRIDDIFEEFQQVDSSDSRIYGGTGLGLSITRRVLKLIGGSVSVRSQLGKGSTFTLLIPLRTETEADQQGKHQHLPPPILTPDPEGPIEFDVTDDREHLDGVKKVILVVDDEREALYIMRKYLHDRNYQVIFPADGEDVVGLARQYRPFAITLDIIMPRKNGWEILEELKTDATTREIPVIVTSILAERERAFEMGADEYLMKPFEPQKLHVLLATLESRLKKKRVVLDLPKFFKNKTRELGKRLSVTKGNGNGSAPRHKILLVDDDKDTQYAIHYVLEKAGYEVFFADEGQEAIKRAQAYRPDLILMDIMMPGIDGYEATRRLKMMDDFKNIPIVAMTAKAMKGDREKTVLAGCDDYIAKPFMSHEILHMVEKWLPAHRRD